MAEIIFKNKKNDAKSKAKEASNSDLSLGIFANFFRWLIMLACLIVLGSGYWWLLKPKYDAIINNEEFKKEEEVYQDKVKYLKQLREAQNAYNSITSSDKDKVDTILALGQDIETFKITLLRELAYVAKINNGAKIENIEVTPLDNSTDKFINIAKDRSFSLPTSNIQIVTVSFTIKDVDYDGLKGILYRLEKSLRLMDVTKFDYDPTAHTAQLEVFTYYLKP